MAWHRSWFPVAPDVQLLFVHQMKLLMSFYLLVSLARRSFAFAVQMERRRNKGRDLLKWSKGPLCLQKYGRVPLLHPHHRRDHP